MMWMAVNLNIGSRQKFETSTAVAIEYQIRSILPCDYSCE